MKYQAVIFDLGGTLAPAVSWTEQQSTIGRMADALGIPVGKFTEAWNATFENRMKGTFNGSRTCIQEVCRQLKVSVVEHRIDTAVKIELEELTPCVINHRPEALYVLERLKFQGVGTGLISDCSSEVPDLWEKTSLAPLIEVTIFSCLTGTKKPDARLFQMALERLKVKAENCIYVADGIGQELAGANRLGIKAVMLHVEGENENDPYREEWDGVVISSLREVLDLVR
jgi:putative hydrolase of the HAD superfamily